MTKDISLQVHQIMHHFNYHLKVKKIKMISLIVMTRTTNVLESTQLKQLQAFWAAHLSIASPSQLSTYC